MKTLFKTSAGIIIETVSISADDEEKRAGELVAKGFVDSTDWVTTPKSGGSYISGVYTSPLAPVDSLAGLRTKASSLWTLVDIADWLKAKG